MNTISLGLDTFGDVSLGPDGKLQPMDQVLRDVVDQAVLADDLGIDFIGLGEHHRDDFAISAPEIVLATIAGRTRRIKLGTAVTVLSTDDPVRVFQRFERGPHSDGISGCGLGLAIVERVAAAHHGSITLDSSPALGGARFCIRLPLNHGHLAR